MLSGPLAAVAQGGVEQYRSEVPTAKGKKDPTPSESNQPQSSGTLSQEAQDALPNTGEGADLEKLATEGRVGAPADHKRKKQDDKNEYSTTSEKAGDGAVGAGGGSDDGGNASGAVSSAVTDWDDPLVPILAGLFLLLVLAATVVAVRRRRRSA